MGCLTGLSESKAAAAAYGFLLSQERLNQTGWRSGNRAACPIVLPKSAVDLPVSAASTSATMCASRSSRASFFRRSRPKITESVALLEKGWFRPLPTA